MSDREKELRRELAVYRGLPLAFGGMLGSAALCSAIFGEGWHVHVAALAGAAFCVYLTVYDYRRGCR